MNSHDGNEDIVDDDDNFDRGGSSTDVLEVLELHYTKTEAAEMDNSRGSSSHYSQEGENSDKRETESSGLGQGKVDLDQQTKGLVLLPVSTSCEMKKQASLPLHRQSNTSIGAGPPSLRRNDNGGLTVPPSFNRGDNFGWPTTTTTAAAPPRARAAHGQRPRARHPGAYRVRREGHASPVTSNEFGNGGDANLRDRDNSRPSYRIQGELVVSRTNIVHAEAITDSDNEAEHEKALESRVMSRVKYFLLGTIGIVAVSVLGVILGLRNSSSDNITNTLEPTSTSSPTMNPSGMPSVSPARIRESMEDWIQLHSPWTSFDDPESAQTRALEWAATDARAISLLLSKDLLLLERFALAVLTYTLDVYVSIDNLAVVADASCVNGTTSSILPVTFLCDEDGHLTDIDSKGGVIHGAFPPEMGLLTRLSSYRWEAVFEWSGGIPSQIGLMTSLREINLCVPILTGLTGPIPSEIGNLHLLESLCLEGHTLGYPLPTTFWQLDNLKEATIGFNSIGNNGEFVDFPTEVFQLTGLAELINFIPPKQFVGSIPTDVGLLSNLETFDVKWNIRGTLPTELGLLSRLKAFRVEDQLGLVGTIPSEIGRLSALEVLIVNGTLLSGQLPSELGLLTGLSNLTLAGHAEVEHTFSGTLPREVGQLSNLKKILLRGTNVDAVMFSEIGRLTTLSSLWISTHSLAGTVPSRPDVASGATAIPSEIGLLTDLETLVLRDANLEGTIPVELTRLQWLRVIDLGLNGLDGPIPTGIFSMPSLYYLDISDLNHSAFAIPSEIGRFAPLDVPIPLGEHSRAMLGMSRMGVSGPIPTDIGRSHGLQSLNISGNSLTGILPSELGLLKRLVVVNAGPGNEELDWSSLPVLSSLSTLDITSMDMGSVPAFVFDLPSLRELNFSGNQLASGALPTELATVTTLRSLALNAVGVVGSRIPSEFGRLWQLRHLELARNEFDGGLPSELGNLTNLRWLDVSSASLSGTLPTELLELELLTVLHLEDNPDLTGSIPGDFLNLTTLNDVFLQGTALTGVVSCDGQWRYDFTVVVECGNIYCDCCLNADSEYMNKSCFEL